MSRRPVARVVYRDKETKDRYDVATIWPGDRGFDGHIGGFRAETEAKDGQYKKMPLVEALALVDQGRGFLDVWRVGERTGSGASSPGTAPPPDDFGEDDIPF